MIKNRAELCQAQVKLPQLENESELGLSQLTNME